MLFKQSNQIAFFYSAESKERVSDGDDEIDEDGLHHSVHSEPSEPQDSVSTEDAYATSDQGGHGDSNEAEHSASGTSFGGHNKDDTEHNKLRGGVSEGSDGEPSSSASRPSTDDQPGNADNGDDSDLDDLSLGNDVTGSKGYDESKEPAQGSSVSNMWPVYA